MAKWLDENGLSHFWSILSNRLSGKVDKVDGKGLSSNDYTSGEKTKLAGIASQAQANVIESVTIDGKNQTITNKAVALDLSSYATDSELAGAKSALEARIKAVEDGGIALSTTIADDDTKAVSAGAVYDYKTANDAVVAGHTSSISSLNTEVAKKINAADVASTYAKKEDISNVYKYKGSKATVADLPQTGNTAGDVWNVEERGINYAWTGTVWDPLGELFTVTAISNSEIDTICS